jgi:hypothetical protein
MADSGILKPVNLDSKLIAFIIPANILPITPTIVPKTFLIFVTNPMILSGLAKNLIKF